jgi:thymidylate synthase
MLLTHIEAKTLPEAWFLCLSALHAEKGHRIYRIDRGSYAGQQRMELDFVTVHIEFPGSRPLVPDVPPGVPAPTTQEYVEGYLPYLMTGAKKPNEDYTYGEDIEAQIPQVIEMYRRDGHNTNQAFMAVGRAESITLKDPQCLRMIDTRISDGKLHFVVYFRSWDLWGGFPANLAGIQILKEYMAGEIGVGDGELIALSKGLHLYDYSWELARALLRKG